MNSPYFLESKGKTLQNTDQLTAAFKMSTEFFKKVIKNFDDFF